MLHNPLILPYSFLTFLTDKFCCEKCLKDVHPNHGMEEIEKFADGLESTYRVYTTKAKEF